MSQDYTDQVPPYKAWKTRNLAWLLDDAESGEPSEPDPAVDEGIRRAVDELGISHEARHAVGPGDQWDRNTELHTPTPSRDRTQKRHRVVVARLERDRQARVILVWMAIAVLCFAAAWILTTVNASGSQ